MPTPPTPIITTELPLFTFAEPITAPTPVTVAQPTIAVATDGTSFLRGTTNCSFTKALSAQV